jgi:competence protein ComEC
MGVKNPYRLPFAAYPAVRIMLLLIAGITAVYALDPSFLQAGLLFLFFLLIWIISEFLFRKKSKIIATRISIVCYCFIISIGACLLALIHAGREDNSRAITETLDLFAWENIHISGDVLQTGKSGGGRGVLVVEVTESIIKGYEWRQNYRIRLYGEPGIMIAEGQRLRGTLRLYEFPERRNPHEFDYGGWLIRQGISAHGELVSVTSIEEGSTGGWNRYRSRVQANVDRVFSGDQAPMAKALLLGYKGDLAPEIRQQFSRSGLSHIMAVSGLHVGFVVAPFWLIIPWLWRIKHGKWVGLIMLTLLLFGYAGLTGFSASVSRASLMAWLITYGKLFHKVRNSINLTAVAASVLLLINPGQLMNIGFQLSFSAVFIILLVLPEVQRVIPDAYRFGKKGALISVILVSVVVQAGLFPILVWYFGEFSIAGPVANALVLPVLSFTVPAGLLFAILAPVHDGVIQAGILPVQYSLEWIQWVASAIGSREESFITINVRSVWLFLIWLCIILFTASLRIPSIRFKWLIMTLISINGFLIEQTLIKNEKRVLKVTFLDVGQADAVHIRTPDGKHLLSDAGRWSPFSNSGERVLLPYFREKGITRLDAVILSHPHADHIGGMPDLIREMEIGVIYQSDYDYDSVIYRTYMNLARQKEIPVLTPYAGDIIDIDESIRLFVLGPENDGRRPSNPNNRSLVFRLDYGVTSFLFTGDAETDQEREIAMRYGDLLNTDVYKAGHHGSNTSSTELLLNYVQPEYTVASLAFRNQFRHPGRDAVLRIQAYSERQKFTSISGAVQLVSNGNRVSKNHWKLASIH